MLARILDVAIWLTVVAIFFGAATWATVYESLSVALVACIGGLTAIFMPLMAAAEKEGEGRRREEG